MALLNNAKLPYYDNIKTLSSNRFLDLTDMENKEINIKMREIG